MSKSSVHFILLKSIKVYAFHGCMQEEQRIGSNYTIDLKIGMDLEKAGQTDDLSDTVNYDLFYQMVFRQMQTPSRLIENVALRIVDGILKKYLFVRSVKIKLCKVNPPIEGEIKKVCVLMKRHRENALEK